MGSIIFSTSATVAKQSIVATMVPLCATSLERVLGCALPFNVHPMLIGAWSEIPLSDNFSGLPSMLIDGGLCNNRCVGQDANTRSMHENECALLS